ncbi:M16 family metallopeptidase [Effusibacillus dendaii]|uniref:Putative zinc protease YmxG n=1 Tax=Effusibacillus dendaii TaxID=2743772 RepID=A0A7I8D8R7_9BACL|nr:pitrilysin family protein [Effusibacillus dendaii]BCJ86538.1 putative zinc protease YmxG [Effusibacillus dendaii]
MKGDFSIKRTVCKNGMVVLTQHTPHFNGAAALFRFGAGSSQEEGSDAWGTAHFLEHMVFQGTKQKNHDRLMTDLARVGASANAATGFDATVYELTAPADTLPQALDIMGEMLSGFALDPEAVARERDIILEELRMTRDDPAAWGEDCLYHLVLGDFGHPILGTEASLPKLDRSRLRKFADDFYTPDNLIVSIVGNIDQSAVLDSVERWFTDKKQTEGRAERQRLADGRAKGGQRNGEQAGPEVSKGGHPKRLHVSDENEQEHLLLGFSAPALTDKALPVLDILSLILGGDSWSRLFRKVRNELGLAYSVGGFYSGWKERGIYGIQSATHSDQAAQLLAAIRQEIESIRTNVTDDELALAKATLKANLLFQSDQVMWRAERMMQNEAVFGRVRELTEDVESIEAATREQVIDLARSMLDEEQESIVTVGKVEL